MVISFGEFSLDEERRQLLRGNEPVHLSPKALQLLSILVQVSPSAVPKADLQDRLWPATFVTEGSLATLVTELRSALGDDAREPRFIRTLYGFGYSFAAPVRRSVAPAESEPQRRRPLGHLSSAAAFGALSVLLLLASRSTPETSTLPVVGQPIRSIAVLPFDTTGADRADQHLGLGLPDLVITRLSNVQEIVVRPTSAVREFADHQADVSEIARKLKVDALVEGSIRTSPDRVRVTVQLLNIRDNKTIWAERFDEKRADIFTIEDSMSGKLAEALRLRLTADEKMLLGKRYTSDPDAYQLYVQARYHLEHASSGRPYADEPDRAVEFFQKAVEKDPKFAAAWAGMAHAYVPGTVFGRFAPEIGWPRAEQAANTALRLDPGLSEAYTALGNVKAFWDLDFDGAMRLYTRALEINPRDPSALLCSSYLVRALGRFDEAIAFSKRLIEVNPVSANAQWSLANAYLTAGQNDLAEKQVQVVLGMDPNYEEGHIALVRLAIARGDYDRAIAEARQQTQGSQNPRALAFLGYALGRAGRRDEAREVLKQLSQRSTPQLAFHQAVVYAGLGDADAAIPLLQKGVEDRSYALRLKTEPVFLPFHSDPRFLALLHRVGFKE